MLVVGTRVTYIRLALETVVDKIVADILLVVAGLLLANLDWRWPEARAVGGPEKRLDEVFRPG